MARVAMKSLGFICLSWALTTAAQEWPKQHPITFVVTFPPGAIADTFARLVGPKVGESIGQIVVVENRPGATGNIAAQRVRRAAPDGYTILVASNAFAVNPSLFASAGYDPINDFVPVILAGSMPCLISVHPSVPAKNLQELIELARKRPLSYASPGIGTSAHLTMERLKTAAKVDITHVPFTPAQSPMAGVSGETQVVSGGGGPSFVLVKSGKLRPIAVTSAQRIAALPDVPTVNEQGFSGFNDLIWWGFFAPAGTPAPVVARLNSEINRAFELPDIREKLGRLSLDVRSNTPAEFAAFLKEEIPKWAKAVKDTGAKVD